MKTKILNRLNNEKGFAIIWTFLVAMFVLALLSGFHTLVISDSKFGAIDTNNLQAFYLAEAGLDKKITELRAGNIGNINATALGSLGTYQVTYDTSKKLISAVGTSGSMTRTLNAILKTGAQSMPVGVKGGLTTKSKVTVGSMTMYLTVDGREYNTAGALTGNAGDAGVAYFPNPNNSTFYPNGNTKIGGNGTAPTNTMDPTTIETLGTNSDDISINAILGLAENSTYLNAFKFSIPPAGTLINQVYYYTPVSDGTSGLPVATINLGTSMVPGTGILIIDRVGSGCWVKLTGYFKGLIIADHVVLDVTTEIRGGIVLVNSTSSNLYGPTSLGAGITPIIKYCPAALSALPTIVGGYNDSHYAKMTHWSDTKNGSGRM